MKSDNKAKAGLLQPLEIPSRKWAHVTMDLVIDLLESNGFTAIVVFIDKLMKMVHLTRCKKEIIAMEYAQIFVDSVFRLHSLREVIMSDGIHISPASFSVHYSTCLAWIFGLVLHLIRKQMGNRGG